MDAILAAILENNLALVKRLIRQQPALVNRRVETAKLYETAIFHWLYVGDCALHLAAAGYRLEIVHALISSGADPNSAFNHRLWPCKTQVGVAVVPRKPSPLNDKSSRRFGLVVSAQRSRTEKGKLCSNAPRATTSSNGSPDA